MNFAPISKGQFHCHKWCVEITKQFAKAATFPGFCLPGWFWGLFFLPSIYSPFNETLSCNSVSGCSAFRKASLVCVQRDELAGQYTSNLYSQMSCLFCGSLCEVRSATLEVWGWVGTRKLIHELKKKKERSREGGQKGRGMRMNSKWGCGGMTEPLNMT